MSNVKIRKSLTILASKETVWHTLFDEDQYRKWASAFQEGSYFKTDWAIGSKTVFSDQSGFGLIGHVVERTPFESLSIQYDGILEEGIEDYVSEEAQAIVGTHETYHLIQKEGAVDLEITSDMNEDFFEDMCNIWEEALQEIKHLSENSDPLSE